MRTKLVMILALALAPVLASPASADRPLLRPIRMLAQAGAIQASCTVFEVQGSKDGSNVDAALKPIEKKLRDLGKWTAFKLVGKADVTAVHRKPAAADLKGGGKATIVLKDKVGEGKKPRLRLNLEVLGKDGTQIIDSTFVSDSGDYMLFNDEDYILAVGCSAK